MPEMPNTYLDLFWGYAAFFGLLALFVGFLALEQLRLRRKISELQDEIGRGLQSRAKADKLDQSSRAQMR